MVTERLRKGSHLLSTFPQECGLLDYFTSVHKTDFHGTKMTEIINRSYFCSFRNLWFGYFGRTYFITALMLSVKQVFA